MSSPRTWPNGVPTTIERQGNSETPINTVLHQPTDWGPGLSRSRTTFQTYKFVISTEMNRAEYVLFKQFFEMTLANGALDFNYPHAEWGWRTVKFDRRMWTPRTLKNDNKLVTLNLIDTARYVEPTS